MIDSQVVSVVRQSEVCGTRARLEFVFDWTQRNKIVSLGNSLLQSQRLQSVAAELFGLRSNTGNIVVCVVVVVDDAFAFVRQANKSLPVSEQTNPQIDNKRLLKSFH